MKKFVFLFIFCLSACYSYSKQTIELDSETVSQCVERYELKPFAHYFGLFYPTPPAGDLANFGQIDKGIFRGARPTAKGLCQLKQMGIKTIVSLENLDMVVNWEQQQTEKLGLHFVHIPLSIFEAPNPQEVEHFFSAIGETQQPAYFHCMQGSDRTGVMAFLYRIRKQNWAPDRAYAEMESFGFHTYLWHIWKLSLLRSP